MTQKERSNGGEKESAKGRTTKRKKRNEITAQLQQYSIAAAAFELAARPHRCHNK